MDLPIIYSTCTDHELTCAVARYIVGKESPRPTEPPYASSEDRIVPLFRGVNYTISHRVEPDGVERHCVTIFNLPPRFTVSACATTMARAMCLAALINSEKVRVMEKESVS